MNKTAKIFKKYTKYIFENKILTVPVAVLIFLGIVSAIVWRLSVSYVQIADFFTGTVSFVLRFILTRATHFLPFSLAEFMLFTSAPVIIYLIAKFIYNIVRAKRAGKTRPAVLLKGIFRIIAFCGYVMFIFTFTLGVCYGKTPVNEKMDFERRPLETEELSSAMKILTGEINKIAGNIEHVDFETGSTIMPYSLDELNKKLNDAYKNMLDKYDLFIRINSKVKPVILSEQLSKMHITGIYSFFSGEANVNIGFPDYNLPFTAAHEMAHLMGVGREDEANFVAFLVCMHSGDDYIRYSGLVNMSEYIRNALVEADISAYFNAVADMPVIVINEWTAFSKFYDKYRNTKISKVASAANDAYLMAQGQKHGVRSYGLVVDLATVYLIELYENN